MKLDSIKISFEQDLLEDFNKDCFEHSKKWTTSGTVKFNQYALEKTYKPIGVKSLIVTNYGNSTKCIMELSAKVLKEDYFNGLDKNTIEQAIENINKTLAYKVKCRPEEMQVFHCDTSENLEVSENINNYIYDLFGLNPNSYFKQESYPARTKIKTGIEYIHRVQPKSKSKHRMILYDKQRDLIRSVNKKLLSYLDLNKFENVLRAERNLKNFEQMKQALGFKFDKQSEYLLSKKTDKNKPIKKGKITLADFFQSKERPILKLYNKILGIGFSGIYQGIFNDMHIKEQEKIRGIWGVIVACNKDMRIINDLLKISFSRSNYNKKKKKYREVYLMMKAEQGEFNPARIEEIRDLLKNAS